MKKYYFLFSAFVLMLLLLNNINAGDRMVLVERFTSSTCGPCAANNPTMDAFLSSIDADKIVGISYHMNWPAPGNDPFYLHNPSDNNSRRTYYGINSIPEARMDGLINVLPAYNQSTLQSYFGSRTNVLSPITMVVTDTIVGDSMKIKVILYCEAGLTNPNVVLHMAVVEKYKQFPSPPGSNGETVFRDIMRKMIPDGNLATPLTLLPGQFTVIQKTIYMNPEWQANQMKALVFVQDNANKEILNAAVEPVNFAMLPNVGYKVVQQGQSQSETFKIKLPFVAPGYNSPVTFTAVTDPVVSGITISFPNGNVLSNYSDSISMTVSSTAAVALGEYRVVITGTNTNNKVHKTSVIYLVGKNYVSTSSSRPSLIYKVDGVPYAVSKYFVWNVGSVHTLADSTQTIGNIRYVFQSWSQGGNGTQEITVTTAPTNFIINYKLQNKLLASNSPAVNININGGNAFYDSASTASISLSALQVQYNGLTYYFQRWQGVGNGSYTGTNPSPQIVMNNVIVQTAIWDTIAPIGIGNISSEVPSEYSLFQNYPNPFNPVTSIKYGLPKDGEVKLTVYDVLGNEVTVLFNAYRKAGYYEDVFDATNIASGIYFYRINAGQFTDIKKMVLIK